MSATSAGEWQMLVYFGATIRTTVPQGGLTIRYSSLPGCKLVSNAGWVLGTWSNGTTTPLPSHSGFTAAAVRTTSGADYTGLKLTWQKDGTSACALEGQTEELAFRSKYGPIGAGAAKVTDTTQSSENIIVSNGY